MWVFIRPRGGKECYLLTCEITEGAKFCPIHRFDGLDQIPLRGSETDWKTLNKQSPRRHSAHMNFRARLAATRKVF